jgi:hypothetical protein
MNPTVKASLKSTITALENKSSETTAADFNIKTASDRALAAQKKVGTSESKIEGYQTSLDSVNQQISDPTKIEKSTGGKNNEKIYETDPEETKKLQTEKNNITNLINQAKNEVETARSEAETASNEALKAAGIKQEIITEANELQARLASMQENAREGKDIPEQDLQKLGTDINNFNNKLTKNDNKADVLGNAVYDPLAKGLKNLIKLIEKNINQKDPNTPPPEGSINRKLFDIGIKGEPQTKVTNLITKMSTSNTEINNGKAFSKDEMKAIYTEYKTLTNGMTDSQKNSDVIKGFKTDMEALVNKSGHGDILTETGS